jgi:hypothetical protein
MRAMAAVRILIAAWVFAASSNAPAALVEEVFEVPVTVQTIYGQAHTRNIQVTSWRDDIREKSPFLILNHGRPGSAAAFANMGRQRYVDNSKYFVGLGFAVLIPTRMGYGVTGGEDIEYSGTCQGKAYDPCSGLRLRRPARCSSTQRRCRT